MKLSIVHMVVGLVLIVALSFYFRKGEPFSVPRVVPFELGKMANTQEAFSLAPPAPPVPSVPPAPPALSAPSVSNKPVVSVSDTAYQAMSLKQRSDMLQDIQRVIRDEVRMARQLEVINKEEKEEKEEDEGEEKQNLSDGQGRDYFRRRQMEQGHTEENGEQEYRCPKNPDGSCPPVPDMSQYIRKDQIPCWGCAVDY